MLRTRKTYVISLLIIIALLCLYLVFMNFYPADYYAYVDERIDSMMENPAAMPFSNPGAYIEMRKQEYNEIFSLGSKAVPALESIMAEEEAKGTKGLRYILAGLFRRDIIDGTNYFDKINKRPTK